MTDFDFEILEAIAQYGDAGISCKELEQKHFKGYDLLYNLIELSKIDYQEWEKPNGQTIKFGIENSACLKSRDFISKPFFIGCTVTYSYYSITPRGLTLLRNWQRRQREHYSIEHRRNIMNIFSSIAIGITTGILATVICQKILGL